MLQYTPLSSYTPVPANMPRVETHKASDGVRCERHMYTGAGLGLDQEMIDYCRCLKLQSCRQFERWQSFKNMCIGGCVKHCSFVTMVLKACRLGTSRTPEVGRGRGDSVTSKEQLTLFEICNRVGCTADWGRRETQKHTNTQTKTHKHKNTQTLKHTNTQIQTLRHTNTPKNTNTKEQLKLFEICNRVRGTDDCLDAGVTRNMGGLDKPQQLC